MANPRFFVDIEIDDSTKIISLPTKQAHHAERSLRLATGEQVSIFNGSGLEWSGIINFKDSKVFVENLKINECERESPIQINLIQSLVSPEKLDWIVEKAVETGVTAIYLTPASRSVTKLTQERLEKRLSKLSDLVISASEQCGRNKLMKVSAFTSLKVALASTQTDEKILLAPGASQKAHLSPTTKSVTFAIGPEGGFSSEEIELAVNFGWKPLLLGPRVLRTETAGLAATVWANSIIGDY